MNFVFTKIPISEYQSFTPSPGVVYIVETIGLEDKEAVWN